MTAIPVTASNISVVNGEFFPPRTFKAGEAITAGATVVFEDDLASNTNNPSVINTDISDANKRRVIGIALASVASGEVVAVAMQGAIVTGYNFAPSTTALHRAGNIVFSGDAGLDDTQGTGSIPVGQIIPITVNQSDTRQNLGVFININLTDVGA